MVDVAASLAIHSIRTGLDVVVRTTDRTHAGRPLPVVAEATVLDLLTPVQQSPDDELLSVASLFAGGFDHTSVLMVTGPDGPVEQIRRRRADDRRPHRRRCGQRARESPSTRRRPPSSSSTGGPRRDRPRPDPDRAARQPRSWCSARRRAASSTRSNGRSSSRRRCPPLAVGVLARRGAVVRSAIAAAAVVVATADRRRLGRWQRSATSVPRSAAGLQRVLSTEWPSPVRADLVGTIAAGLADPGSARRVARRLEALASAPACCPSSSAYVGRHRALRPARVPAAQPRRPECDRDHLRHDPGRRQRPRALAAAPRRATAARADRTRRPDRGRDQLLDLVRFDGQIRDETSRQRRPPRCSTRSKRPSRCARSTRRSISTR